MKDEIIAWIWKNSKYAFLLLACVAIFMMLMSGPSWANPNPQSEYNDVMRFLQEDTTDSNPYLGDDIYDCEDFALDTQLRANRHGLACAYVTITSWQNLSEFHAIVAFRIDNKTLFFEPQTDAQIFPAAEDIYSATWEKGKYATRPNDELS